MASPIPSYFYALRVPIALYGTRYVPGYAREAYLQPLREQFMREFRVLAAEASANVLALNERWRSD